MAKRSIGAAIILAALLLVCSCDPESFLRAFGTNVLGGTGGKETVEEITAMIDGSETTYDELVKLVVQATRNPDTEKALIDSLSKDATEESVNGVRQQVSQVATQLEQVNDDALSDLPPTIQKEADKAIDAIKKIQAGLEGGDEAAYTITKGDVAIIQAVSSIVDMIDDSGIMDSGSPSQSDISELISTANEAIKMFTTLKPASAFRSVDLNAVINELVSYMGQQGGEEGGEA